MSGAGLEMSDLGELFGVVRNVGAQESSSSEHATTIERKKENHATARLRRRLVGEEKGNTHADHLRRMRLPRVVAHGAVSTSMVSRARLALVCG